MDNEERVIEVERRLDEAEREISKLTVSIGSLSRTIGHHQTLLRGKEDDVHSVGALEVLRELKKLVSEIKDDVDQFKKRYYREIRAIEKSVPSETEFNEVRSVTMSNRDKILYASGAGGAIALIWRVIDLLAK